MKSLETESYRNHLAGTFYSLAVRKDAFYLFATASRIEGGESITETPDAKDLIIDYHIPRITDAEELAWVEGYLKEQFGWSKGEPNDEDYNLDMSLY